MRRNHRPVLVKLSSATLVASLIWASSCRATGPEPTAQDLVLEGTAQLMELTDRVVPDAARAEQARTVIATYLEDELAYSQRLSGHRRALLALNADHDAAREDFVAVLDALNADRRRFLDRTVDALQALKAHLEPSEWKTVFDGMTAMDAKWEELHR
ncbi:MAG: hypothetical protein ACYTG2_06130 [Planctomycetota bacterium]|jgi:hypothetical protein